MEPEARLLRLRDELQRCRECPLGCIATQAVAGEGDAHAPLMLVGEAPGDQEDLQGHPFVGPAGRLLDRASGRDGGALADAPADRGHSRARPWLQDLRAADAIVSGAVANRSPMSNMSAGQ